jgi:hypothetical protein
MKEAVTAKYDTRRPTYVQAPKSSSESLLATISEKARPERRLPILTAKATKPVNLRPGLLANQPQHGPLEPRNKVKHAVRFFSREKAVATVCCW